MEGLYIMHDYVVGLEADTRATTARLVLSQKHSHVSEQASIGLRKTHQSRVTMNSISSKTENAVFNIEIVRSNRLENVWAVKNTLCRTSAERDKGI